MLLRNKKKNLKKISPLRKHSAKAVSSGFYKWEHAINTQFCVWYRQYIYQISSRNIIYYTE